MRSLLIAALVTFCCAPVIAQQPVDQTCFGRRAREAAAAQAAMQAARQIIGEQRVQTELLGRQLAVQTEIKDLMLLGMAQANQTPARPAQLPAQLPSQLPPGSGLYAVPAPTAPYLVPAPTAPYAVPAPTAPYLVPAPTAPYAVPQPTSPYSLQAPGAPYQVGTPGGGMGGGQPQLGVSVGVGGLQGGLSVPPPTPMQPIAPQRFVASGGSWQRSR